MRIYIASTLVLVFLSGCGAAVISRKIEGAGTEGVPYALPKTVLEAEVEIKEVPAGLYKVWLTAAGNDATTRLKVIAAIATLFGRKPDDIESKIKNLPWEADPNPLDVARANDIKAKIETAGGTIWLDPAPNEFRVDLTLIPERVADWSRGYVIDTSPNPLMAFFSADDWKIDVTTSGSLETISSTNTDTTGDVVVELAKAATLFFGGIPTLLPPALVPLSSEQKTQKEEIEKFVRDTLRKLKGKHRVVAEDFSKLLKERTQKFPIGPRSAESIAQTGIGAEPLDKAPSPNVPTIVIGTEHAAHLDKAPREGKSIAQIVIGAERLDKASLPEAPTEGEGIFVTVDRPVKLNAEFQLNIGTDAPKWVSVTEIQRVAHVPDEAQIVVVPMRRAAFVTVKNTLNLDSGRVKGATGNIPSVVSHK